MLNEKEKEILNVIVATWDEADNPLPGGFCYNDVFNVLDKLGLERPKFLEAICKLANDIQANKS
jgi:hypothetical protein